MTTEILINVAPRENRAALIENGVLTELFVEKVNGSYSGVMGLPLYETANILKAHGVPVWRGMIGAA